MCITRRRTAPSLSPSPPSFPTSLPQPPSCSCPTARALSCLELPPSPSPKALKKAYRKLALRLHPDKRRAEGERRPSSPTSVVDFCDLSSSYAHLQDKFDGGGTADCRCPECTGRSEASGAGRRERRERRAPRPPLATGRLEDLLRFLGDGRRPNGEGFSLGFSRGFSSGLGVDRRVAELTRRLVGGIQEDAQEDAREASERAERAAALERLRAKLGRKKVLRGERGEGEPRQALNWGACKPLRSCKEVMFLSV